jgi:hypothetical protein
MIRTFNFFRLLVQSRFAESLAALGDRPWPRNGWEQWACFRQGLFDTVNRSVWDGRSIFGGMATAVSLAACGRIQEAERIVRKLDARWESRFFRAGLAELLAPYSGRLALELLRPYQGNFDGSRGRKIVLLEQVGETPAATSLLEEALHNGQAAREPQLTLLASNLLETTPAGKLSRLNDFLAAYRLAPLRLKDAGLPPSVDNLGAAESLAPVTGPLVSVLMTAYNIGDRIETALTGLLNQTWRNIEVIVVDDASSDDTGAVVQALAALDNRIRYFRLPSNAGTYVAKTFGFRQAAGEFVTCHDSDDWSHPQRLERQVQPLIDDPMLMATTSQWVRMEDSGRYHVRLVYPLMQLNPASPMFRREAVASQAGLWDAARIGADSEFHSRLRLVFGRKAVKRVAQPLTLGAHRENSLMTAPETGYSATGMSPTRLAYWESWAYWHIQCLRTGSRPQLPVIEAAARPFAAPPEVRVAPEKINAALGLDR